MKCKPLGNLRGNSWAFSFEGKKSLNVVLYKLELLRIVPYPCIVSVLVVPAFFGNKRQWFGQ